MSQSYGPHFPTQGINPGHIHRDTRVSPARAYMYKGGDPTNAAANWTELDLADTPDIFVKKSEGTSGIQVTSVPTSSVVSLMKMMSRILSHGVISGGTIADNGDGTVTDRTAADAITADFITFVTRFRTIRQEGEDYKTANGL